MYNKGHQLILTANGWLSIRKIILLSNVFVHSFIYNKSDNIVVPITFREATMRIAPFSVDNPIGSSVQIICLRVSLKVLLPSISLNIWMSIKILR